MSIATPTISLQLTEEHVIDEPTSARFFDLYLEVFGPLRYAAAARHILTREEWDEEMRDERILKIVAWDGAVPIGMSMIALDLAAVPWASADFYAARYPNRTVYYCGISLVLPEYQGHSVFGLMIRRAFEVARRNGALGAWDCAAVTRDQTHLVDKLVHVMQGDIPFEPQLVDTQSYYVVDPCDPATLASADDEPTIDLRDPSKLRPT
jgi:GNAT superfamily N-acetyltransferase